MLAEERAKARGSSRDCFGAGGDGGEICRLLVGLEGVESAGLPVLSEIASGVLCNSDSGEFTSARVASKVLERVEDRVSGAAGVSGRSVSLFSELFLPVTWSHERLQQWSRVFFAVKFRRHPGWKEWPQSLQST